MAAYGIYIYIYIPIYPIYPFWRILSTQIQVWWPVRAYEAHTFILLRLMKDMILSDFSGFYQTFGDLLRVTKLKCCTTCDEILTFVNMRYSPYILYPPWNEHLSPLKKRMVGRQSFLLGARPSSRFLASDHTIHSWYPWNISELNIVVSVGWFQNLYLQNDKKRVFHHFHL